MQCIVRSTLLAITIEMHHYNYADFAERHNGSLNPLHGATMGA